MERIRIEKIDEIDFSKPEVIKSLAKGYAVLLKDRTSGGKGCSKKA